MIVDSAVSGILAQRPEDNFNFRNPDYLPIFKARSERLKRLRKMTPAQLAALKLFYKNNPANFINDWAITVDPRVATQKDPRGGMRSPVMPFLLFPKQWELIDWIMARWRGDELGIVEKSRDVGASWIFIALACTLCMFYDNISIGLGSYVEDKIDRTGDPDTLFYKARMFMMYLPPEFKGGWDLRKHSAHMRLQFPGTNSSLTGEAGDNIGRGGRKSLYGVDESAHLERPQLIDMSLSANTNCRIDFSSVKGAANPFAEKRHSGKYPVFTFHWTDDPRKDQAWYDAFLEKYGPIVTAQEVDLNYSASVDMQIISPQWVAAALDAHIKLKLDMTGKKLSALDIADSGIDKNAWGYRNGLILSAAEHWSGNQIDTHATAERAAGFMSQLAIPECIYDSVGVGAGTKGAGRVINEARKLEKKKPLRWWPYAGSGPVEFPEEFVKGDNGQPLERTNKVHFLNKAAQDWWALRFRFLMTWRALNGKTFSPDHLISIDSKLPNLSRLMIELSQPQYEFNSTGKIVVVKTPEGTVSPNLADMVRMLYCVRQAPMQVSDSAMDAY